MPKYFNATFGPLVWNDKGQTIGGGEWLIVDESTPQIDEYLDTQEMVLVEDPSDSQPARTRRSKSQEK